jgi:hypothetical protein
VASSSKNKIEIKEFARRVERLCDFLIAKKTEGSGRDGSKDLQILEDLKSDAADIQFQELEVFDGLSDYIQGIIVSPKES